MTPPHASSLASCDRLAHRRNAGPAASHHRTGAHQRTSVAAAMPPPLDHRIPHPPEPRPGLPLTVPRWFPCCRSRCGARPATTDQHSAGAPSSSRRTSAAAAAAPPPANHRTPPHPPSASLLQFSTYSQLA